MIRLILTLLLAYSVPAGAAERGAAVPDYPAVEVAPRMWVIEGPLDYPSAENQGFRNNPAFIVTRSGVVVIDPGSSVQSGEMVLRQIRKVTDAPVVALLNTHVHGDHWLGNQAFWEADPTVKIYGHPKMIAAIANGAGAYWINSYLQLTNGAIAGTVVVPPNIAVSHGDSVVVGDDRFTFHHLGQAHSDNDLMIAVNDNALLFLADNGCNQRIVRMDDGSFAGNIAALAHAAALQPQVVVPGHGPVGGVALIEQYHDYLTTLYQTVEKLYEEGYSDYEMRPLVAEQLQRFIDWVGFERELGKNISIAYLEVERAAF